MKKYFSKVGAYFIVYFGGILLGLLTESFAPLPFLLLFEMSGLALNILKVVLVVAVTATWLFISTRTIGYKTREFRPATILIAALAVFAMQQALSPLFHNAEYISGGARTLTYAVFLKGKAVIWNAKTASVEGVPQWGYHVMMLLLNAIYLPTMIAGEYFGVKKRQKDRKKLTGENESFQ